jgi:hypothetical protein
MSKDASEIRQQFVEGKMCAFKAVLALELFMSVSEIPEALGLSMPELLLECARDAEWYVNRLAENGELVLSRWASRPLWASRSLSSRGTRSPAIY